MGALLLLVQTRRREKPNDSGIARIKGSDSPLILLLSYCFLALFCSYLAFIICSMTVATLSRAFTTAIVDSGFSSRHVMKSSRANSSPISSTPEKSKVIAAPFSKLMISSRASAPDIILQVLRLSLTRNNTLVLIIYV